jgi:OOP family OmpA-OmpF porin
MRNRLGVSLLVTCAVAIPGLAWAQDGQGLAGLDGAELRGALEQRYDAALALTQDPVIIRANDPRYIWANEAKVQCGIAIGFTKSGTRDETSINKCAFAADMMTRVPAPPAPLPVAAPPAPSCPPQQNPGLVFFDWDSAEIPADARQTVEFVSRNAAQCNWRNFTVTGHADKSGSNDYNMGLSQRRADAVAALMASMGIAQASVTTAARGEEQPRVPTDDGVRELQNRRVEITVR